MVARVTAGWNVRLSFEPGRFIAAEAGVLLTRTIRTKRSGSSCIRHGNICNRRLCCCLC